MNNFEVIIGIENHVELKTKSKMFSPAPVSYGEEHNTQICEVDLGYPGALPSVNQEGVRLAILACNGLNMQIDELLRFDRKNYFYPDLVKGFQITQQYHPIGKNGFIIVKDENGNDKKIDIERLHIEEDTAKQIHKGDTTYIDYNRSGIGLVEIVSRPVIRSAKEAVDYVNNLREILLFLGISDVKMNEGSLRCDVNISLRPYGYPEFGPKVEIKNLNSLNNVKKSIEFEIQRQSKLILSGQEVQQETRRFDENIQETVLMRTKSDAVDYRYFREPNINPIKLDSAWIKATIDASPELASVKRNRYLNDYTFNEEETNYILASLELTNFFEETVKLNVEPKKVLNYLLTDIKALMNKDNISIDQSQLTPNDLKTIVDLLDKGEISSKHVKTLLPIAFSSNQSVEQIIEGHNLKLINDEQTIKNYLTPIVETNRNLIVEQYESRPERVEKTIMGQLMKETGGNVNPEKANLIINEMIQSVIK
ncbi:Asp-tRNA(Asn)/Glu-tRNA(Gln) amidotransferase subunit GatB [Spiroplasma culicicola]|uniref:Aspartyl/glutamyl-tRNA(Asn/Gln) amidotransferase subunit B n=1 Tax=Spiroplasma culicicola AES-1 TaxID=1276246 RepID=W6A648_9MOLU|nr:Asp-tRNA(Asn)/Glu-tRNA(Gln) amidotransferase subunit GatB [Spiroplasma culicicola]AHI52472.1 aspartyl/glutamyl-tRNA amidotransferase subunit B [Spiroplasma culicicola AES-1]